VGGEKEMLGRADAHIKQNAFFILFLSCRPFASRDGNKAKQKRRQCSRSFYDDFVIDAQ
jgi:glutathione peroxidase-family protein